MSEDEADRLIAALERFIEEKHVRLHTGTDNAQEPLRQARQRLKAELVETSEAEALMGDFTR